MDNSCVLITNGNIFSMIALAGWLDQYGKNILKVYVTRRLPSSKGNIRGALKMLKNSGLAYTWFKVWGNKFLPMKLRLRGLPASVEDYLRLHGHQTPVDYVDSVNTEEVVVEVRSLEADYLVSFSATQRFKEPLIQAPRKAAINTHYGALPGYAGLSPYFWHLYNKEPFFGVTLHQIIPELDAGPIIEQRKETMEGARTALEVLLRMAACVSPMLLRFFGAQTSLANARPQDLSGRSYFRHPTRRQMREFHGSGFRMMDRSCQQAAVRRVRRLAQSVG